MDSAPLLSSMRYMALAAGLANEEQINDAEMKPILNITKLLIYTSAQTDHNAVIYHKVFTL